MSLFTVDSHNVFGIAVEEAGTYNVRIASSSQYTTTKDAGKPMAIFDYEVLDGKYKGGTIRFDNKVWDATSKEKQEISAKRFSTIAVALGAADGTGFDSIEQFVNQSIGHDLAVTVDWETGQNGKTYLTVQGYQQTMQDGSKPNGVKRPVEQNGGNNASGFGSHSHNTNNGFGSQPTGGFGSSGVNAGKTTYDSGTASKYHGDGFPPIPSNSPF